MTLIRSDTPAREAAERCSCAVELKGKDQALYCRTRHHRAQRNGNKLGVFIIILALHPASYFFYSSGFSKWGFQSRFNAPKHLVSHEPNLLLGHTRPSAVTNTVYEGLLCNALHTAFIRHYNVFMRHYKTRHKLS